MPKKQKSNTLTILGELTDREISFIHCMRQHPSAYHLPKSIEREHNVHRKGTIIGIEGANSAQRRNMLQQLTDRVIERGETYIAHPYHDLTIRSGVNVERYRVENPNLTSNTQIFEYTHRCIEYTRDVYYLSYQQSFTYDYAFVDTTMLHVIAKFITSLQPLNSNSIAFTKDLGFWKVSSLLWGDTCEPPDSILYACHPSSPVNRHTYKPATVPEQTLEGLILDSLVVARRALHECVSHPPLWGTSRVHFTAEQLDFMLDHHKDVPGDCDLPPEN